MTQALSAVPILRFGAGELAMAIAAADVRTIVGVRPGTPHISTLFGKRPPISCSGQRRIEILSRSQKGVAAAFLVDPPVQMMTCHQEDILPLMPSLWSHSWDPIMGFARIEGHTIALLDIPKLVEALDQWLATRTQP